ncbi:MAG: LysM domain-containing protein [Acidobacteriota bacterium]
MSIATLVLVLLLGADPAGGATDKIDWHVVQPGETLQGITESYLGTFRLWRENWKLNPDIQNPNRLSPGQRIRVIVERTLPPGGAEIEEVAN